MTEILKSVVKLIRPNQWYKNLVVFLALIFSNNLFNLELFMLAFYGFLALIIISSANYIFNDLFDRERDKINPEKKDRPIASGKIGLILACVLFLIFLFFGLGYAYSLGVLFFYCVLGIFLVSTFYTLVFKDILFADLIAISSNFVLRAISGAVIIGVYISPWLVVGIFFFAMFLVSGKRYGEMNYLNEKAHLHRKVLKGYSNELLLSLFNVFMTVLILVFALYSFSSEHKFLIWTIPLFLFLVLRYYYLIISNSGIVRNPERFFRDFPLLIGIVIFLMAVILLINI